MPQEKIAILIDSTSDVPAELRDKYHMYTAPLTVIYHDAEYRDGIDISTEEVCARFAEEIPPPRCPARR